MTELKKFSLDEQVEADATKYIEVEAHGGVYTLGSLTSFDMVEWIDLNNDKNNPKGKHAGLILVVKCLVDPVTHARVPTDKLEETIEKFKRKSAPDNGKLAAAALELNGMNVKRAEEVKNDSGEASTGASPTGSASPSADKTST